LCWPFFSEKLPAVVEFLKFLNCLKQKTDRKTCYAKPVEVWRLLHVFCQGNPFVLLQDGMEAFRLLFSMQMFQGFLARSNDFVGCRKPPDNL